MTLRRNVELKSGPALVLMGRLPKAVPFLVVLVLLVVGLLQHSAAGAAVLLLLGALLAWLLYLAWPALQLQARVLRLAVLALVVYSAAIRLG